MNERQDRLQALHKEGGLLQASSFRKQLSSLSLHFSDRRRGIDSTPKEGKRGGSSVRSTLFFSKDIEAIGTYFPLAIVLAELVRFLSASRSVRRRFHIEIEAPNKSKKFVYTVREKPF